MFEFLNFVFSDLTLGKSAQQLFIPAQITPIINYPWRCLKRGFFLLITNNLPLRFTILQSTLRFLIEALTFIKMFLALGLSAITDKLICT
jgi:hypothetical protein